VRLGNSGENVFRSNYNLIIFLTLAEGLTNIHGFHKYFVATIGKNYEFIKPCHVKCRMLRVIKPNIVYLYSFPYLINCCVSRDAACSHDIILVKYICLCNAFLWLWW